MNKNLIIILTVSLLCLNFILAVTPDGSVAAGDNMNIFITLLFIAATLGLFYTLFLTIAKLVTAEETIYDVLLSWGFFILLIMVNHLTAHYVEDVFMYDLTNSFISLTPYTNGVLPLLALIITFFIKGTQKRKVLGVKELNGRLS